jgi:RimJ/RimL family protein N-acetyltransferase
VQLNLPFCGLNFSLRSVTLKDEHKILELRSDPNISRFLNPTTPQGHREWLIDQVNKPKDFYFAVQNNKSEEVDGYIGIYNYEEKNAEWGRWIISNNPSAVFESYWLILKYGFSTGLVEIYCRTDVRNSTAMKLHNNLPYTTKQEEIMEPNREVIRHTLHKNDWPKFENEISKFIKVRAL